jgi:hypothetical protein
MTRGATDVKHPSRPRGAAALAGAIALLRCGGDPGPRCIPSCPDTASCRNFDPQACAGLTCGVACHDSCGEPDGSCWVLCADPTNCLDDCGNFNATACSGHECDPEQAGLDTCGQPADAC